MSEGGFFYQAFVFLAAAVVSVPTAKRVGLGSVLGYLLAGVVIGPYALGLLGEEGQDVLHFAEFGVVMMLFLVGLELEPDRLWRLRIPILGLGGLQVLLTSAVIASAGWVVGLSVPEALAVGMTLALSSTAIVLQTLQEKGLMKTAGGSSAFSVLLFQDVAVIPMLALFPLLARHPAPAADGHHSATWVDGLPAAAQTAVVLGAVAAIVVGGHYVVKPAFRWIARTKLREIFVAAALLLVIAIALLMSKVGLSPALGTFVAGVVLSGSEYRHELESDVEPFKGLLLGLFFIAVGATIDLRVVTAMPGTVLGIVAALMVSKCLVLLGLARVFRLGTDQALFFGFALAQGGEFAFVLFSFAQQSGVLTPETIAPLVVAVAFSMALTPLVLVAFERVVAPRVGTKENAADYDDDIEGGAPVIIAGYGRFGQIASRLLDAEGIAATVLEADSDQVDLLRRFGRKVYYGDASRVDLLRSAGAAEAKVLVLAVDRPEKTLELARTAKTHFPHLKVIARARGRIDAYDLLEAGVDHVHRETFDTALEVGVDVLRALGRRAYRARRAASSFKRNDEALLRRLAGLHRDDDFVDQVKRANAEAAEVLARDLNRGEDERVDHAWDVDRLVGPAD
ncbi:MAG: monovalent cation:proton antiporter-2 (CPA2) family protein [Myxococcota bacterium]